MNEFYKTCINRVVDYIQANLGEDLSLNRLSEVACYSKFHLNRIFSAYMGESVYQYIKRVRLEKSAELLSADPNVSITDVAQMYGFENASSFAKSCKHHFKMTATQWRTQLNSTCFSEPAPVPMERGGFFVNQSSPVWTYHLDNAVRRVVIEDIPSLTFAYIRHIGPYQGGEVLFGDVCTRFTQWAAARELINDNTIILYESTIKHGRQ